jgi:hypothetical protein
MNRTAAPFTVTIDHISPKHGMWLVVVAGSGVLHEAIATSREQAWSIALATLRGMIALERIRNLP